MTCEGVRPIDWLRALMDTDVVGQTVALRAAFALMRRAPGRPSEASGWVFFMSEAEMAQVARTSPAQVRRGVRVLQDAGYLVKHRRGGGVHRRANEWVLSLPAHRPPASAEDEASPLTSERRAPQTHRSPASADNARSPLKTASVTAQDGLGHRSPVSDQESSYSRETFIIMAGSSADVPNEHDDDDDDNADHLAAEKARQLGELIDRIAAERSVP